MSGTVKTQLDADHALKGTHGIGDGLFLRVVDRGGSLSGSYFLRIQHRGKRRDVSIGSRNRTKLRDAKRLAGLARAAIHAGTCPLEAMGRQKTPKPPHSLELRAVVERTFASLQPTLKDGGKAGRWLSPLQQHVLPALGAMDVGGIDAEVVKRTLAPIWHTQPSVAEKALQRLRMTLRYAEDEGAAVVVGACDTAKRLLGPQAKRETNIVSTPFAQVPALYKRICERQATGAVLALRFAILTVHRMKPVRLARIEELDLAAGVWTVPAENLKGALGKTEDVRCPLSPEAQRIAALAMGARTSGWLFPSPTGRTVVSDVGVTKVLNALEEPGRAHGFRSSFADWAEAGGHRFETIEGCLQHAVGNRVARAYRRDDQLGPRRALLDEWAAHVVSERDAAQRGQLAVVK